MSRNALTLALLSSVGWSAAAFAQTAVEPAETPSASAAPAKSDQKADSSIADIVVTAQRRSERLSDVPLSISVASADQIKSQGIISPAGLERIVPGFTYQRSSYGVPVYSIRGVGFLDTALGVPPTVSVYIDQVPLAFSPMAAGVTLDLERVEVLKGPQGTLYGQNSTGGAVNYIAAKPTSTFHAGGDVSIGRFSEVDAGGYVSGPLTDTLRARIALRTEQRGDWQQNYTRDDSLGKRHFTTGRFLLDWSPNDLGSVALGLNGWKDTSDTQAAQYFGYQPTANPPQIPEPGEILTNYPLAPRNARAADWNPALDGQLKNDNWFYQMYLRGNVQPWDNVSLSLISTFTNYKANYFVDPDGVTLSNLELHKYGRLQSFFNELRLSSQGDSRLSWMFGGSVQFDEISDDEIILPPFISTNTEPLAFLGLPYKITSLRNDNNQKVSTTAVFGSLGYKLTDTLTLEASARYTDEHRKFTGCSYDTDGSVVPIADILGSLAGVPPTVVPGGCYTFDDVKQERLPVYNLSLNEDNVSWRASLSYKPTSDFLLYANVTKGYKGGSFPTLTAITVDEFTPARQEELLAYEAGFRTTFLDRKVQLSGAIFHYQYHDKQVLGIFQNIFGNLPRLTNIPRSRVNGGEVQLMLAPFHGLKLNVGATYVDSKVTGHFSDLSNPLGQIVDIYGESFPNSPKWQFTGDAQYDFPIGSRMTGYLGANGSYRTSAQAGFGRVPQFVIPGYGLLDLRAGIESDAGWRVELWGRNVTNTLYWNNIAKLTDTFSRTTGLPVTYGVRLAYDF